MIPGLEPEACKHTEHGDDRTEVLISIAMSLKRIADALQEPNEYGEVGGAAIAGSIKRGLRS